ncbi:MAG: NCS1 family nucleobase:cation symporter-1 [Deltaproteobacteria bacterium]|nr:NCS1 family nucleobase:cation symporter-1 [Deltaproteobacteria bacterium]
MHVAVPIEETGLPPDLAASPLYNADLAPVPIALRDWTTYNFAALWIAMAHCIPTYMYAGNVLATGMNAWQAMLVVALGNLIVLVPILLNAHPGTKYGIPFPVLARASFGTTGAQIPAMLRALVACGWFGVQTWIGGEAVRTFLQALWPGFAALNETVLPTGLGLGSAITFFLFWALNIAIIFRGMNAVRLFENWAAPIVLVMAAALMAWVVWQVGGVGELLTKPSEFATFSEFWWVFVPQVTAMIGFWSTLSLNVPDFTRFGRDQRQQMIGQAIGLPPTMIGFSLMGLVITSASARMLPAAPLKELWNPEYILSQITSATPIGLEHPLIASAAARILVAVFALFGIAVATISVNIAANVISPANDFANLAPKRINFQMGGLITGLLGIFILPWKLLETQGAYVFTWLIGYSALLGPLAGILIADYWVVRKTELDVPDLYRPNGRYAGTNPVAVLALVLGVLPNVPGFLAAIGVRQHEVPDLWDAIYVYAWFVGFGIAFFVYLAGMRLRR